MDDVEACQRLGRVLEVVGRWNELGEEPEEVQHGSRLDSDDMLTDPYQLSHAVAISIGSAQDHLLALRTMVVDAGVLHMGAPFTITRSALENAAQALWLLAPDDQAVRVTRRLQAAVRDIDDNHFAGLALNAASRADGSWREGRRQRVAGLALAAGLEPQLVLERAPGWGRIVREAARPAGLEPGHVEALWRIGSGYAHGQPWAMLAAAEMRRMEGQPADAKVHDYRVTADVPMVFSLASAALLTLNEALKLRERHRKRWVGPTATNL